MLNIHIYPSNFKFESRILKETGSIIKLGLASSVLIISKGDSQQPAKESISEKVDLYRIRTLMSRINSKNKAFLILDYIEFYFRLVLVILKLPVKVINAHSLMVLPLSVVVKWIKGSKLIYDPHELETERVGLTGIGKRISKIVERIFIQHINAIIVVSPSIADWYKSTYRLKNVVMILNAPVYTLVKHTDILRRTLSISSSHIVFIYQGLFMHGRSIEMFIRVFNRVSSEKHLVLMGYGPLTEYVKNESSKCPNIHYLPAVRPAKILEYSSAADVGLSVIENCCLSYYYSLPNKFFEYLMAEIPLIISDFPDMGAIVKKNELGWIAPVKENDLIDLIDSISIETIESKKSKIRSIKRKYSWETEEEKLKVAFEFTAWC